jgi:LysR family transcriptional regulator, glycine cleavage system transcriptional activator
LSIAAAEPVVELVLRPWLKKVNASRKVLSVEVNVCHTRRESRKFDADIRICHCVDGAAPQDAVLLASASVSPACSPAIRRSMLSRLDRPSDLRWNALLRVEKEVDPRNQVDWARWLATQDMATLEPGRWITYAGTATAVAAAEEGAGVLLASIPLMNSHIKRGKLTLLWPECVFHTGGWYAISSSRALTHPLTDGAMQALSDSFRVSRHG